MKKMHLLLGLLALPVCAGAQDWSYDPQGRRDPFLPPTFQATPRCDSKGAAGLTVAEVALRGIVTRSGSRTAVLVAPDGRSVFVAAGASLCDGTVLRVEADAVVLGQGGNGAPLLETRRLLHPELAR